MIMRGGSRRSLRGGHGATPAPEPHTLRQVAKPQTLNPTPYAQLPYAQLLKSERRACRYSELLEAVWGLGLGVWGFGVWGLGFGVWGLDFGFWVLGFGFWVLDFGFWGLGVGLSGFGYIKGT